MSLEDEFARAVDDVLSEALQKYKIKFPRLQRMNAEHGHLEAAKRLVGSKGATEGYMKLLEVGRPDLTLGAVSLRKEFRTLFTDEEIETAKRKMS
ncbi:MAG: hypothetical protein PF441_04290 [Desulfuromusa sp.]|nr:hypothetical protein [Desulfuromusa sp.]